jgi:hypothetical protein
MATLPKWLHESCSSIRTPEGLRALLDLLYELEEKGTADA